MSTSEEPMELYSASLGAWELDALLADIQELTHIVALREKAGHHSGARPAQAWREVCARLVSGASRGLQVEYVHAGQRWCDTVIGGSNGTYSVTRVRLPAEESAPEP